MGLKKLFAEQARKPSGIIGALLTGVKLNQQNRYLEEFCIELLAVDPGDILLEVGFGNGLMINKMAPKLVNGRIHGIDHSGVMVRQATKRNKKYIRQGNVLLQQGNLSHLPFDDQYFNKVVSNNTIYFWDNPLAEAKELLRVLKPGGLLVIGFRTKEQLSDVGPAQVTEVFQHYDPDELEALLSEAGFEPVGLEHKQETQGKYDSFAFLARRPG